MKLLFGQISKVHTQFAFKNIKVRVHSKYHNDSTLPKRIPPELAQSFPGIRKDSGNYKERVRIEVH